MLTPMQYRKLPQETGTQWRRKTCGNVKFHLTKSEKDESARPLSPEDEPGEKVLLEA